MKKNVLIFVCAALLALMVIPAVNLTIANGEKNEKWWSRSVIYNFDFAVAYLARVFYPLGISINPNQVVIGKEGWLYLGDMYAESISVKRRVATAEEIKDVKEIARCSEEWKEWLTRKGVRLYKIMICPDKDSVYPEFAPNWAWPVAGYATDVLLDNVSRESHIDARPELIKAKDQFAEDLYYKTDTHWNRLGAWVAFCAFGREIKRTETDLKWFSKEEARVLKTKERRGGDLAKFLRMAGMLSDIEARVKIIGGNPIETQRYDFETGRLTASGGNPHIAPPMRPLLVRSKHALNNRKVLWLRDSFGTALSPFMAATFTETLQIHYAALEPETLAGLVETYRPDYVFLTVVERDARGEWFKKPRPVMERKK